ncbi:MAG TPA: hypothetical protein VEV43_05495 [Actinomycetota bacterium]|nr:hypothetical protein [Actinomycetota bacterium]
MGDTNTRVVVDEILTTIGSFGGGDSDGGGFDLRPSGRVIKIPPRQDLQVIPAERRDELIVHAIQVMAQDISDEQLREQMTRAAEAALQ